MNTEGLSLANDSDVTIARFHSNFTAKPTPLYTSVLLAHQIASKNLPLSLTISSFIFIQRPFLLATHQTPSLTFLKALCKPTQYPDPGKVQPGVEWRVF